MDVIRMHVFIAYTLTAPVANTRPEGQIRTFTLFYLPPSLVSTRRQAELLAPEVKEYLHLYSPKITFGPLKATSRLMWLPGKMSLTPLLLQSFKYF